MDIEKKMKLAIALQRFFGTIALSTLATDHKWVSTACLIFTAAASEYINYINPGKKVEPLPTKGVNHGTVYVLLFIVSLLLLSSCGKRQMPTVSKSDSTVVKYIQRDSFITVPGDTVTNTVIVDCPEKGKPVIKTITPKKSGTRSSISTTIEGNKIINKCECAEEKAKIKWMERDLQRYQKETVTPPPVIIKETPFWNWLIIGALAALTIILLIKGKF
jgi:hypothetical protein